jgi:hypothetical protein
VTSDRRCVTAVGRRHHPGQFLVLRADGTADLWELRQDGVTEKIDDETLSPLEEHMADQTPGLAVFRPDGRAVAVATRAGVFVWRIDERDSTLLTDDTSTVRAYGRGGFLVLSMNERQDQL